MLQLIKNLAQDAKDEIFDCIDAFKGKPVKGHGEFSKRFNTGIACFGTRLRPRLSEILL